MLGAHRTAHSVARDFGHEEVFQLLNGADSGGPEAGAGV